MPGKLTYERILQKYLRDELRVLNAHLPRKQKPLSDLLRELIQSNPSTDDNSSLMRASRWRPTIAEVRERVAEMTLNLPIASDAWHEVEGKAREYDDYDEAKKWPSWSHPLIKQTVRDLGGLRAIYYSNNPSTDRAHFLRLYKEQREAAVRIVQDGLPAAQVVPIDPGQTRALPTGTTDQES